MIYGYKDGFYPIDSMGDPPSKSASADLYRQIYTATERIRQFFKKQLPFDTENSECLGSARSYREIIGARKLRCAFVYS